MGGNYRDPTCRQLLGSPLVRLVFPEPWIFVVQYDLEMSSCQVDCLLRINNRTLMNIYDRSDRPILLT